MIRIYIPGEVPTLHIRINFDKTHEDVKDYYLTENFRSIPQIVNVAKSAYICQPEQIAKGDDFQKT